MSKLKILALIFVVISLGVAQTKILLCNFENRGVDSTLIRTTTQLLKDALNATYKFTVIELPAETKCYGVVDASNFAKRFGATKALIGNIMRIGTKTYHSYQYIDANSASVELADKIETPELEEFPIMCDRIATAIAEKKPYKETVEPEKIITTEVEPGFKRPRKPYASIFLTAGYYYPLGKIRTTPEVPRDTLSSKVVNLNVATSFETPNLMTMLQMGLMRGRYFETDINFDLMVNYLLSKGDFAPMTGVGIGITSFRWTDSRGDKHNTDGLSLSAGVGILGLRSYYFRLMAALYANYTISNAWGNYPSIKVLFGVTTPSMGPDATLKIPPGCVGGIIGGMFLTGLLIALTS